MFPGSLQWRLVFIFILITIFLVVPIGLLLNRSVESSSYDSFKEGIDYGFQNWTVKSNATIDDMMKSLDEDNDKVLFNIIGRYKSYTIINRNNIRDIKDSSDIVFIEMGEEDFLNEILSSQNLLAVMAGKDEGDSDKLVHANGRNFFDYARLVKLSDGEYVLYFRYDSAAWREIVQEFNDIILSTLMLSVVFSLIVGYLLSKTIIIPIQRITHKAEGIASGDFDQMLEVKSQDEIGKLTGAFNYMARSLKMTLAEISSEKNKIETILNYMTDGVIAFNMEGRVIHINPAAKAMTETEGFDWTFNEYSKRYGLNVAIEELMYLDSLSTKEATVTINDRSIRIYFAVFADTQNKPEGIIAVMQDVTEQEKLENMRREFVANVSHELRTPITSIKSYSETLLDGAIEDREVSGRFLEVINSEADRMARIVKDLLQLSRLDNKQMKWNIKAGSVESLVRKVCERMKMEAETKGQTLECHVIGEIPEINMDRDRIDQVIVNIISNAIKYTPEGGKISIYLRKAHEEVHIKVADTGIGIPRKDLTRIFERFYRVDKARSREMGGTGLGLAIAKEIVEAHKGTISISSETGKGTEVTVKLPLEADNV